MKIRIDTVSAREKLKVRRDPYWQRITKGAYIGYRKMASGPGGTWLARVHNETTKKQDQKPLGSFVERPDSERFDLAVAQARTWFEHLDRGGQVAEITVGMACKRLLEKMRAEGKVVAAKDYEVRFNRWLFSNPKLANTQMRHLKPKQVVDWRKALASTPALPQDRRKIGTRPRAASTVNREMAVFRTALNNALAEGYATSDAAWKKALAAIKGAAGRRDVYLDISERKQLLADLPSEAIPLFRAMSILPLRPGAIAGLIVSNFDKRLKVLTIGKDKTGEDRKIKLPPAIASFFEEHTRDKEPGAHVFSREGGKPWNKDAWKYPIKIAARAAKLPPTATAYALRHSTITDLIVVAKLDTLTVAKLAGRGPVNPS